MPNFIWKGIKSGAYKEGTIEAKNEHEATYLVRKNHVIIYSVESLEKEKMLQSQHGLQIAIYYFFTLITPIDLRRWKVLGDLQVEKIIITLRRR